MTEAVSKVPRLKICVAPKLFHGIRRPGEGKGGKDALDATVKLHELDWPKLVDSLSRLKVVEQKERGPYFVFAEFGDEAPNGEMYRRNSSVKQFYGAVLDIDTPNSPSLEEVRAQLLDKGLAHVVYSTHSYDPLTAGKENKFRVVVPYSEPVEPREQPFVVLGLAVLLGVEETFDRCSQTASQPMYWHSAPASRKDEAIFLASVDGEPLDPDEAHALGKMEAGDNAGRNYRVPPSEMRPGMQMDAGERHNQFVGFLKWAKSNGDSLEQAMLRIHAINDELDEPLDDDQVEGLRRVWASFERNNNAFGFEHHRTNIANLPMQQKEVYESVLAQMANSKSVLDAAELKELFTLIKAARPGATLKTIEAHYKELTAEAVERDQETIGQLRQKVDAFLKKGLRPYVWLTEPDKVVSMRDGTTMPIRAFKNKIGRAYARCIERFGPLFLELKLGREYVLDEALIREAARLGYHPAEDDLYEFKGVTYLNTYRKPEGESIAGDVTPLLAHFEYLIPDQREREWFISMIAFAKQNPGYLIKYMYIIEGGKGIGKSIIRQRVLQVVFGDSNVQEVTREMLADDKKAWISSAHVDVFEEFAYPADRQGREAVHNFMKKYTANTHVPRRAMQKDYVEVPNFSLKLGFKNPEDKIKVEPGDRRMVIVRAPMRQKGEDYYNDLCDWLDRDSSKAAMREFFESWDYKAVDFTPDFPLRTRYTAEVENNADDWPGSVLDIALDHPATPFDPHAPLMFESDIIQIIKGLSSSQGYEGKMAEGLALGRRGPRQLVRDTLEVMGFTCLTPERFKRTIGKTQIWDKAWLMRGTHRSMALSYQQGFHWTQYLGEFGDFSRDAKEFVKRVREEREEMEAGMDEWPEDDSLID